MATATENKERPINRTAEQVQAILRGATQLRVKMEPQPVPRKGGWSWTPPSAKLDERLGYLVPIHCWVDGVHPTESGAAAIMRDCPFGAIGNRLWVQETWAEHYSGMESFGPHYRADLPESRDAAMTANHAFGLMQWKPAVDMPREFSRLTLEITGVRVERLQDISEEDAQAEGVESRTVRIGNSVHPNLESCQSYRLPFVDLWNSINGDGAFDANPWVWCVSFRKV